MKRINRVVVLAFLALFTLCGCAVRLSRMNDAGKAELLATERGRVSQLSDPVAKVRSYIVISNILIDFASGMARDGNLAEMNGLLAQYTTAIQDARDALVKSDRNAEKKPAGFKDLELALRTQIRRLQDLGGSLNLEDRAPVNAASDAAAQVREEIFHRIFPQGSPSVALVQKG